MKKKIIICCFAVYMCMINVCMAASFNMSYLFGGNNYLAKVDSTNGAINEVSPSYFDINSDGSLKITYELKQEFIDQMHDRGVKVVPFLSNHWSRDLGRSALKNREKLANEIIKAIDKYDLDGVNVDIENVTEVDRDNYTDFVKILSEKMPEGKTVAVAVAANPNGYKTGWHASYDYEQLGKYADYIMIMTYDEHYEGGTQGPVASYDFVEESIQYALKYVPSEKIVMGLAFFGRYWNEEDVGGRGVAYSLINQIFEDYPPTIVYDEESRTMIGTIHVSKKQAEEDRYIFQAGTYNFYYETPETIKEKLQLVDKYNLKGSGSWALGQEMTDMWEDTSMWRKDVNVLLQFKDIVENKIDFADGKERTLYKTLNIFEEITNKSMAEKYFDLIYSSKNSMGLQGTVLSIEQLWNHK